MLKILHNLFVKKTDPAIAGLYNVCVAAARQPVFYRDYGVPDTLDGRFDLLLLHIVLTMLRMKDGDARQKLFDLMFADMDRSLREIGVGDMSIGKKMKPMLAGFYGRATAYKAALADSHDEALVTSLSRNLFGLASGTAPHAAEVARYVRASVTKLSTQSDRDIEQGLLSFPVLS